MATMLSVADGSIERPNGNRFPRLEDLEAVRLSAPGDPAYFRQIAERSGQALRLIESNSLRTADEFLRISKCVAVTDSAFRSTRVRYELILCAAALGSEEARRYLAGEWDRLQRALGRPVRFGIKREAPASALAEAAPACVREVLRDPAKARDSAQLGTADEELIHLAGSGAAESTNVVSRSEHAPSAKIVQLQRLIDAGRVATAEDFKCAALIMHRSGYYGGYLLAHELALCALLLDGGDEARWLVAATYDRMLRAAGHDQRFGTQYVGRGASSQQAQVDSAGISDRQREALGCAPLAR